jgi:hypothetical protein
MIAAAVSGNQQLERLEIFINTKSRRFVGDGIIRFDLPPFAVFAEAPLLFHLILLSKRRPTVWAAISKIRSSANDVDSSGGSSNARPTRSSKTSVGLALLDPPYDFIHMIEGEPKIRKNPVTRI